MFTTKYLTVLLIFKFENLTVFKGQKLKLAFHIHRMGKGFAFVIRGHYF